MQIVSLKTLIPALLITSLLAACSESEAPAAPAPPAIETAAPAMPAPPVVESATAPAEPMAAAPTSELTGIESCDKYLNEYEACVKSASATNAVAAAALKQGLDSTRGMWKQMSASDVQKQALETSCQAALATLPQVRASVGCK